MRVECGARGLWIFRHQFEVAERGDQGHDERQKERQPYGSADLLGNLAGEGVNPGAENVADDEQQQQPRAHHPAQARLARDDGLEPVANGNISHLVSFRPMRSGYV